MKWKEKFGWSDPKRLLRKENLDISDKCRILPSPKLTARPLKTDCWKMIFPFEMAYFRGAMLVPRDLFLGFSSQGQK